MRIPRLYHDGDLNNPVVTLSESAARHAVQVLRLTVDSRLTLFNGDGYDYEGRIKSIKKLSVDILIDQKHLLNNESSFELSLGLSIIKSDRMDFAIQKATELGVKNITPLVSDYSSIQIKNDKQDKKLQHWRGVIQHACEQCGRAVLPALSTISRLDEWIQYDVEHTLVLNPLATWSFKQLDKMDRIRLCIGPEGGFSDNELNLFNRLQLQQVSLGPRILRAETAAISSLTLIQHALGDLSAGTINKCSAKSKI